MTRLEMLLTCLSEECAELSKVACKSIRFGLDSDNKGKMPKKNRQLLEEEFSDILGIIHMLHEEGHIGSKISIEGLEKKKKRFEEYSQYSKELGTLTE